MQKKIEINSQIIIMLRDAGVPSWVRPSMIWEERWLRGDYTPEMAIREAALKIRLFTPRREKK